MDAGNRTSLARTHQSPRWSRPDPRARLRRRREDTGRARMTSIATEGTRGEMPKEDAVPPRILWHLFAISRHLAGRLDFQSAIHAVAEEISHFLPYDHLDVCILEPAGRVTAAYETGLATGWGTGESREVAQSPIRALLLGDTDEMLTPDATCDPRFDFPGSFRQPIVDSRLRARIHVPLVVDKAVIGALSISSHAPGAYRAEDVRLARFVADQLSPYFFALRAAELSRKAAIVEAEARVREETLREGASQLTQELELERQRIGMDLHDQTLADLTRMIRDLRAGGAGADPARMLSRLEDCVTDLRRIIDTAVPSLLELFGFTHAVRIHLERAVESVGDIAVSVEDLTWGAPDRIEANARVALYRIVQEAVNNATHHAGANRIAVRIDRYAGRLRVTVTDDGTFIPARSARLGGVSHMRTRARLLGAEFSLLTQGETRIELRLPLEVPA